MTSSDNTLEKLLDDKLAEVFDSLARLSVEVHAEPPNESYLSLQRMLGDKVAELKRFLAGLGVREEAVDQELQKRITTLQGNVNRQGTPEIKIREREAARFGLFRKVKTLNDGHTAHVVFSSDSRTLAEVQHNGTIEFLTSHTGIRTKSVRIEAAWPIEISRDLDIAIFTRLPLRNAVCFYDLDGQTEVRASIPLKAAYGIYSISVAPDKRTVAVGTDRGIMFLYLRRSMEVDETYDLKLEAPPVDLQFDDAGRHVLCYGKDHTVRVLDVFGRLQIGEVLDVSPRQRIKFDPGGHSFLSMSLVEESSFLRHEVLTGRVDRYPAWPATYGPDGQMLAMSQARWGGGERNLWLFRNPSDITGTLRQHLGRGGSVQNIEVSGDGRHVVLSGPAMCELWTSEP